jgi:hypothetical protein
MSIRTLEQDAVLLEDLFQSVLVLQNLLVKETLIQIVILDQWVVGECSPV